MSGEEIDLEQMISEVSAKGKDEKTKEEDAAWWDDLLKHPFFAKEGPKPDEMTPEWEALQAMKFDEDEPEDCALAYKNEGNYFFKLKKYRSAVEHYTEGIKQRCGNMELNAILFCNRAASHWFLGNYRSSMKDCACSRKLKPNHLKAIIKGAQCLIELKMPEVAVKWCDDGLALEPKNEKLLELRAEAEQLKKTVARDRRKEKLKQEREEKAENDLIKALQDRGVQFGDQSSTNIKLHLLESKHPGGGRVFLDQDGALNWPVLFVYPEHNETDFIQAFNENSCFDDHIKMMFGLESSPPPWDPQKLYTPHTVQVYFEERTEKKLLRVPQELTLNQIFKNKKFFIMCGTPSFYILRKGSQFASDFIKSYS